MMVGKILKLGEIAIYSHILHLILFNSDGMEVLGIIIGIITTLYCINQRDLLMRDKKAGK